jgi:hypothetical protein
MFRKEKKCKNTECDLLINYDKNPKKFFCNLKCKNRYHYLKDTDENAEIISRIKALKTNNKIIVNFIAAGVFKIDAEVARALGFNRRVYMDLFRRFPSEKNTRSLRRIQDVYFVFDLLENCIFLYDSNATKYVA